MLHVLSREAADTNFTVFSLTLPGLEPMNYHILSEYAITPILLNFYRTFHEKYITRYKQ